MAEQSADLRKVVADGYDGIAVSPDDAELELNALDNAAAKSTLITVDTDCPLSNRLCFIGSDNYEAGRACADLVKQAVPDGGTVVISVGRLAKYSADRRRQGLIDALLDRSIDPARESDPVEGELKGKKYSIAATMLDDFNADTVTASHKGNAAKASRTRPVSWDCLPTARRHWWPGLLQQIRMHTRRLSASTSIRGRSRRFRREASTARFDNISMISVTNPCDCSPAR